MFRNEFDELIYRETYLGNQYGAPSSLDGRIVVDIGAHVGYFSLLCLERGAEHVYCFEANPENAELIDNTLHQYVGRYTVDQRAVWSCTSPPGLVWVPPLGTNTGGCRIVSDDSSGKMLPVGAVSLDNILEHINSQHCQPAWLIKSDCEGSEYPAFLSCNRLNEVCVILGEAHSLMPAPKHFRVVGYDQNDYDMQLLARVLSAKGFTVQYDKLVQWEDGHEIKERRDPVVVVPGSPADVAENPNQGIVLFKAEIGSGK